MTLYIISHQTVHQQNIHYWYEFISVGLNQS